MIDFLLKKDSPKLALIIRTISWIGKNWFQLIVIIFLLQLYTTRNVQLLVNSSNETTNSLVSQQSVTSLTSYPEEHQELFVGFNILEKDEPNYNPKWKSADFSNLAFIINSKLANTKRVNHEIVSEKLTNCREYVKRFAKSAIIEMEKYGIPASITLAQGLLESDAGESRLASESNNHFGIKCRSKCRGCTCRNYADDDIYDMFRVFDSSWDSFREHSLLLQIERYSHLRKIDPKDYKKWAVGLKKAGYATDKNYHNKLIRIIEELDLSQFDK